MKRGRGSSSTSNGYPPPLPRVLSSVPSAVDWLQESLYGPSARQWVSLSQSSRAALLDRPSGTVRPRVFSYGPKPLGARHGDRRYSAMRLLQASPALRECVRRRSRREVLFARRVAGARGLRGPYRRTVFSQYSC